MVEISVIIPSRISTHARIEKFKKTISSLINQTVERGRYEIIIIDDGSDINFQYELKEFIDRRNTPVRLYHQGKCGPATAKNLGIKEAKGGILLFLGDDVIAETNLLEEHLRVHKIYAGCVVGNPIFSPSTSNVFGIFTALDFGDLKEETKYDIGSKFGFCTACVSVSRISLGEELFDEEFKDAAYEDTELGLRLHKKDIKIVFTRRTSVYHDHVHDFRSIVRQARSCGKASAYLRKKHPARNVVLTGAHRGFEYNVKKAVYGIMYGFCRMIFAENTKIPLWYAKIVYHYNSMIGIEEGKRDYAAN